MSAPQGIPAPTLRAVFPIWKATPLSLTGKEFKHLIGPNGKGPALQRNYRVISGPKSN